MKKNTKDPGKHIRHYFRIYFYKNGEGNTLKGRIEDIMDEKVAISFQGVDSEAIIDFINQQLQKEQGVLFGSEVSPKVLKPKPNMVKKSDTVEARKVSTQSGIYNRAHGAVELNMNIPEKVFSPESNITDSEITAEEIETHHITYLENIQTDLLESGNIAFSFSPSNLPFTGTYRLKARARLTSPNEQVYNVHGSCWAYFI
jgi:hypothetical protein